MESIHINTDVRFSQRFLKQIFYIFIRKAQKVPVLPEMR